MPLSDLSEDEKEVVFACLKCVASGKVLEHDWEFQTTFGIYPSELLAVVEAWPDVNDSDPGVRAAIQNSMNNLLGYPHGMHSRWNEFMPVSREEVRRVLKKYLVTWGVQRTDYFGGLY